MLPLLKGEDWTEVSDIDEVTHRFRYEEDDALTWYDCEHEFGDEISTDIVSKWATMPHHDDVSHYEDEVLLSMFLDNYESEDDDVIIHVNVYQKEYEKWDLEKKEG
ncbi:hypothetical protein [Natrinema altunense]|uniref:Uncharacterized protein n=1 Tax=Natrinema altunense TaxID=222984 RepID=A0A482XZP0_9EURY|nr:hypothetical protein [Natrinema altunense]RZH69259.1 hypothetical protein ELS17_07435 [Natrinema altunense]